MPRPAVRSTWRGAAAEGAGEAVVVGGTTVWEARRRGGCEKSFTRARELGSIRRGCSPRQHAYGSCAPAEFQRPLVGLARNSAGSRIDATVLRRRAHNGNLRVVG